MGQLIMKMSAFGVNDKSAIQWFYNLDWRCYHGSADLSLFKRSVSNCIHLNNMFGTSDCMHSKALKNYCITLIFSIRPLSNL